MRISLSAAVPIALALALPACATVPANPQGPVTTTIERGAAAWDRFRAVALAWLPLLPAERQAQVRAALDAGDRAVAAARLAVTATEAAGALSRASEAMAEVRAGVSR